MSTRFSDHYGISVSQAGLDFVDVPLGTDIRVFIDPYAVTVAKTPWSERCHKIVSNFFQMVLDALRSGNRDAAMQLLCVLREDNRTRTGFSEFEPQGTGVGPEKADLLIQALTSSEAFQSGLIEDIEDGALFANSIGRDTISDIMVNLLHEPLAEYTREQCDLFGVPLDAKDKLWAWRPGQGWVIVEVDLPAAHGRPILLIPRVIVRKDLSLKPDRFLTDFLDQYVDHGNLSATRALEETLQEALPTKGKHGKKTHRGQVRDKLKGKGTTKDVMARIAGHFPEALKGFKERARKTRPVLSPFDIEALQRDRHTIDVANIMAEVRSAASSADEVWRAAVGVVSGLIAGFHPLLQHPQPITGAKNGVAGVIMTNTGASGVLWRARRLGGGANRPNIVVLTASKPIDKELLSSLGYAEMIAEAGAGAVLLVGPTIAPATRARRKQLAMGGLLVSTIDEIAEIVQMEVEPEVALDALTKLIYG